MLVQGDTLLIDIATIQDHIKDFYTVLQASDTHIQANSDVHKYGLCNILCIVTT